MKKRFLEAGRVAGTHGVRGQLRLACTCDGPEFLLRFDTLYWDGRAFRVEKSSVFKNMLLIKLEGVDDLDAAAAMKGAVLTFDRESAGLPQGRYFVQDLLGMAVFEADTGEELGRLEDVYSLPAHDVYVVGNGARRYQIPAVPAFIRSVDEETGEMRVRIIGGMEEDRAD